MTQLCDETFILEIWGVCSTPSLPLLPSTSWPRVEVSVKVPFMSERSVSKLFVLDRNIWYHKVQKKKTKQTTF